MEAPYVSRFSKLNKDMLIQLLETLAPTYVFSYEHPFFYVSFRESSTKIPVFSVNISSLIEINRFREIINILSGTADFSILKKREGYNAPSSDYCEYENGWFTGVDICSPDYGVHYYLGILCLNEIHSLEIFEGEVTEREFSRKGPTFNLSLPFERCDIVNLEETLIEILEDLEERIVP